MVVLVPRKRAASMDAIGKWEPRWTRSPRPLVASPVLSSPAVDAAEQVRRSEEQTGTHASLGPVLVRDSRLEDAPPTALVRES